MRRFFASVFLVFFVAQSSGGAIAASSNSAATPFKADLAAFAASVVADFQGSVMYALTGHANYEQSLAPPSFDRSLLGQHTLPNIGKRRGVKGHARFGSFHENIRYPHGAPDPRVRIKDKRMARLMGSGHVQVRPVGGARGHSVGPRTGVRPHSATRSASPDVVLSGGPVDAGAGINHWWAYEQRAIPGLGNAMVNAATGNMLIQATDVSVPERGLGLVFQRTWNSQSIHDAAGDDGGGPAIEGNGWTSTFDAHIIFQQSEIGIQGNPTITVYDIDGTRYDYTYDTASQGWDPPAGQHAILEPDPQDATGCSYWWLKKSGVAYWFHTPTGESTNGSGACGTPAARIGKLYEISGRNANNNIQLVYKFSGAQTTDQNIITITAQHSNGQSLTLHYTMAGAYNELTSIDRPDKATIQYIYDGNGNLIEVDKPGNGSGGAIANDTNDLLPGNVPETYDLTESGSTPNQVCGPRGAIATYAHPANPQEGSCLSFTLNASNQLTMWETSGVLNFTPSDGTNTVLQSGTGAPATGWQNWNPATFKGYAGSTTTMADADGHKTEWTADSLGRPIEIAQYDAAQPTVDTPPAGITLPTSPTWLISTQAWDSDNNLIAVIDPRGNAVTVAEPTQSPNPYETDYAYDAMGNTLMVSLPSATSNVKGSLAAVRPTTTYTYDQFNNVVTFCDPVYNAKAGVGWGSAVSCPTTVGTTNATGATIYKYDYTDTTIEPYGRLTTKYTPTGYHATITYDTATTDDGLPLSIAGAAIPQTGDPSTTSRTPSAALVYDSAGIGNITASGEGNGASHIQYDAMNRPVSASDADGVTSYTCYNLDGTRLYTETAYQYFLSTGSTCPTVAALENGTASIPTYAVSYTYDADGDLITERHHFGGIYAPSGTNPTPPGADKTTNFYDGLDRLVEVIKPSDSADIFTANGWMTRYLYDLSQGIGAVQFTNGTAGGAASYSASGNLYKTQEYLPSGTGVDSISATTPVTLANTETNTQWVDVKGTAFDRLNRPTNKFSLVSSGGSSGPVVNSETLIYDNSPLNANVAGMLAQDCNVLGQCQEFNYDADGRQITFFSSDGTSAERKYTYNAGGQTMSITSGALIQSYTYDGDGRLSTSTDPSGSGITDGGTTITHNYYPDGKEQSLDVASSTFTQPGLFKYAYRTDGKLETKAIDDANLAGAASAGTTTLTYYLTNAGRLLQRVEAGAGAYVSTGSAAAVSKTWNAYGFEVTETTPQLGTTTQAGLTNFQYDPEGDLLGTQAPAGSLVAATTWSYRYTTRGELKSWPSVETPGQSNSAAFADGLSVGLAQVGTSATNGGYTTLTQTLSWNDRMGVTLQSTSQLIASVGQRIQPPQTNSWTYDAAGRLNGETSYGGPVPSPLPTRQGTPTPTPSPQPWINLGYSYDAGNHSLYEGFLKWGPNGHPMLIGGTGTTPNAYETLHWNGGQILFSTATINGKVQVDDIKIGMDGDITPADAGYQGLTFYDRGPDGVVMGCHNKTGTDFAGIGGGWTSRLWTGRTESLSPCAYGGSGPSEAMPTSIEWGSGGQDQTRDAQGNGIPNFGAGGLLGVPRADGYAFGLGIVQGVRTFDGGSNAWTTPDVYAGEVADPATQKSYMWNGNNPVSYGDPRGYMILGDFPGFGFDSMTDGFTGSEPLANGGSLSASQLARALSPLEVALVYLDAKLGMMSDYATSNEAAYAASVDYNESGKEVGTVIYQNTSGFGFVSMGSQGSTTGYDPAAQLADARTLGTPVAVWHAHGEDNPDGVTRDISQHWDFMQGQDQRTWLEATYTSMPDGSLYVQWLPRPGCAIIYGNGNC
jgi:YD repeat-containing protein